MIEPSATVGSSDPRRYNTLQYPGRQYSNRDLGYGRSRNPSGLEYASDTDALQSPVLSVRSARTTALPGAAGGRHMGGGGVLARSSSLPRTFQVSIYFTVFRHLLLQKASPFYVDHESKAM